MKKIVFYVCLVILLLITSLACDINQGSELPDNDNDTPPEETPENPEGELVYLNQVTKDGITWTFSEEVPVGQFVNGDYYVVGPVTIVDIDPLPTEDNGRHGSVLNMPGDKNNISSFDSRTAGNRYAPQYRIYPPFDMEPGHTLISSISIENRGDYPAWLREGNETPQSFVRSVSVLTCLDEQVSADAFRPAYVDRSQRIYYADNLRRNLLPELAKVSNIPDIDNLAEHYRRPWLETCFYGFDAAVEYQATYGREAGRAIGMATLLLMLDFEAEEKEELLINVVQYSIDLWGIAREGYPGWIAHGGHGSGRKWPIIFGGIMLGNEEMMNPNDTFPGLKFGEDMHTAFDNCWTGANSVYTGHMGIWKGEPVSSRPSWGPYEHLHPSEWEEELVGYDPFYIGETYRRCCTSIAWVGQALAARLMDAEEFWDHDAFFAYVDRWMTEDDEEYVRIINENIGVDYSAGYLKQGQAWDRFVENMWDEYR
ncbi:MAG: hypothetical protein ACLFPF_09235 [Halanaerobiales bacterium]